jgi:hypothetical protein
VDNLLVAELSGDGTSELDDCSYGILQVTVHRRLSMSRYLVVKTIFKKVKLSL